MKLRRRGGFLLAVVLAIAGIAAALALAMHQGMLHRAVQVRRASDQAGARWIARGALNALAFAVGEAIQPPPPGVAPSTRGPDLYAWLLSSSSVLAKGVPHGDGDDRAWLAQVLGKRVFESIDALARRLPGAEVSVFTEVGLPPPPKGPIVDPVCKRVELRLRAVARVHSIEESLAVTMPLAVYSQLPASGKFTLATREAAHLATANVNADGTPFEPGDAPVVLVHHPSDGDPMAADPFARGAQKALLARSVAPSDVLTTFADRGLVWLGANQPLHLPLAAGGAPYGEEHAVYAPHDGRRVVPIAKPLPDQPGPMRGFQPTDPLNPDVLQGAYVQGTVVPFSVGLDTALLGPSPDPAGGATSTVSRLRLHGSAAMPSPTAVIGQASYTLAALSGIAIDRDVSDADEHAQTTAVGRPLPVRDASEPFLAWTDEAGWDADLIAEQSSYQAPYGHLRPFGRQGEVTNQNAYVDQDGDGSRETQVASEIGHETLHLDLSQWKYANLFAGHVEYKRLMSRYVSIPVNLALELGGRPAEQVADLLRQAAFGKSPPGGWADWQLPHAALVHRDPLHDEPAVRAGGALWLDTRATGPEPFNQLLSGPPERFPGERPIAVRGQRAFEQVFMPGGVMDLAGHRVIVVPDETDTAPGLVFDRVVAVKAGSGGVLEVPRLACPGLVNADGAGFAPLSVHTPELVLKARGPYEAAFSVTRVTNESPDYAVIRGALNTPNVPANLPRPLVVAWDPRLDPTGPQAHFAYRVHAFAVPRVVEVE